MARAKVLGKSILLLILIIILVLFGLLWFDYLGIIQAKKIFAPVYRLAGLQPQTSTAPSSPSDMAEADLDNDRFAKRLEALDIRSEELDKRENDVVTAENNNTQVAQELEDQKKAQEEREKTFNNQVKKYEDNKRNTEQIVQWLVGMQPQAAVEKLMAMPDQQVIDVLRQAEEDAQASGTASSTAYWLQLMPKERVGQLMRKMQSKPTTLDE
ncbi:MAG: flagellar protein FlbB [Treponema sp.]|nr:flagellar protein FlbB [Treponema sp.]